MIFKKKSKKIKKIFSLLTIFLKKYKKMQEKKLKVYAKMW